MRKTVRMELAGRTLELCADFEAMARYEEATGERLASEPLRLGFSNVPVLAAAMCWQQQPAVTAEWIREHLTLDTFRGLSAAVTKALLDNMPGIVEEPDADPPAGEGGANPPTS